MTSEGPFSLAEIGQITLTVTDLTRAVEFYGATLGLKALFRFPKIAFFACNTVRLMLSEDSAANKAKMPPASVIYFRVGEIHSACDSLRYRGLAFEKEPHVVAKMPDHELWMAFFRDPDGNLLALMNEATVQPDYQYND